MSAARQTTPQFSTRARNLHASPIREILALMDTPGMVSFAGGLPAPETFPAVNLSAVSAGTLQYGATESEPALRERIAAALCAMGLPCEPKQILVLSGSQQGIDLVAKLFVDEGTHVAVESPTYLAALQVFRFFGAHFVTLDPAGPGADWQRGRAPSLVYAIPTFQNPTGYCYAASERDALAQICDEHSVPLFEDDPYRDLMYDECDRSPICAHLKRASWVYQGSFSKSLAPGLRLGFLAASEDLITPLTRLKQAADLHSNRISQAIVLDALRDTVRDQRLENLISIYRRKRDYFSQALQFHLGAVATWQSPPGGLFFWIKLMRNIDTRALLAPAIQRGVTFMPGEPFYPDSPERCGALRLNFSHANEAQTERGLATLAQLLR